MSVSGCGLLGSVVAGGAAVKCHGLLLRCALGAPMAVMLLNPCALGNASSAEAPVQWWAGGCESCCLRGGGRPSSDAVVGVA